MTERADEAGVVPNPTVMKVGAEYDRSIHRNPDGRAWAKLFCHTISGLAGPSEASLIRMVLDEDFMTSWFANAMMAMRDHLKATDRPVCTPTLVQAAEAERDKAREEVEHLRKRLAAIANVVSSEP